MSFFYVFIILFLILFCVQLTMKMKVFFNIKNNTGKLQLKFMFIKIFDYKISIVHQNLKLTNKKGKSKFMPIEFSQESIQNYTDFEGIIFRKIYFKTIAVYFNFGLKSDAFASSMVVGTIDIVSKILYSFLKTKKSEVLLKLKTYPSFKSNVIKIGFKAKISISVFDFVWSLMEAVVTKQINSIKNKKVLKGE